MKRPLSIGVPLLSRGRADRDERLRDAERIAAAWPSARLLAIGPSGAIDVLGEKPAWRPATGEPPGDGVLLGAVDGVDHWAVLDPDVTGPTLRELGAVLDDTDAGLVVAAVALIGWHAAARFCPTCGQASAPAPGGWSRRCADGHQEFPRTDAAVIVLVHDGGEKMVLARQEGWAPHRYSVLAGFVEAGESLEAAVVRELAEEIGVDVFDLQYLGSQPWPFPRSLMIGFLAQADPAKPLRPRAGEIESAHWVSRDQVRRALADADGSWRSGPADDGQPLASEGSEESQGPEGELVIRLPGSISIARRMINAWAEAD